MEFFIVGVLFEIGSYYLALVGLERPVINQAGLTETCLPLGLPSSLPRPARKWNLYVNE